MKASETQFQRVIEGTNQFLVPHFQRPYSWTQRQWQILWDDLVELAELDSTKSQITDRPKQHFIGSIVTMPGRSVPEGITKYILIDGQQRLTTLLILLAALRDVARGSQPRLADEIYDLYLSNRHRDGREKFKLLPTQGDGSGENDQTTFVKIIESQTFDNGQPIAKAYRFYSGLLSDLDGEDLQCVKVAVVNRLLLVSIVLDRDDDPYAIFESLNAKGLPLSQADLIRNYFFMRTNVECQQEMYSREWRPMELAVGVDNMPEFFRHYLMRDGGVIKQTEVYFQLKSRLEALGEPEVRRILEDLSIFARYYSLLLDPSCESDMHLREGIDRLNRLEATVAYPFLLNIYHDYATNRLDLCSFRDILDTIENFLVRRYVCSVPRGELNHVFPALYKLARRQRNVVEGVKEVLALRNYPSDDEFRERLVDFRLYGQLQRSAHARIILSRLENSFEHSEPVDVEELTIEHVLPQTLTEEWRRTLGENADSQQERWVHTIGNLTLTGYNAEMSNATFLEKRSVYRESHVELNRYFRDLETWDVQNIECRGRHLAQVTLGVWPNFAPGEFDPLRAGGRVSGTAPARVVIMGEPFEAQNWQIVLKLTLEKVASLGPDVLVDLSREYPKMIGRSKTRFRAPKQLNSDCWYEGNLSAEKIYNFCRDVALHAGLDHEEWRVELDSGGR